MPRLVPVIARSSAPQSPAESASAAVEAAAGADDLPSGAALLALEQAARRGGTGLEAEQLEGLWMLERIWPRGQTRSAALAGGLLRSLGASLRMERRLGVKGTGAEVAPAPLWLTNSVRLGWLELRFQGPGWLRGRRPLLWFQFERLEIRAGERTLLQRTLPAPEPRRQPFFALIATGADRRWLAARGRSGGLAVWRLSPPTR